jgi:hypothetical protein
MSSSGNYWHSFTSDKFNGIGGIPEILLIAIKLIEVNLTMCEVEMLENGES